MQGTAPHRTAPHHTTHHTAPHRTMASLRLSATAGWPCTRLDTGRILAPWYLGPARRRESAWLLTGVVTMAGVRRTANRLVVSCAPTCTSPSAYEWLTLRAGKGRATCGPARMAHPRIPMAHNLRHVPRLTHPGASCRKAPACGTCPFLPSCLERALSRSDIGRSLTEHPSCRPAMARSPCQQGVRRPRCALQVPGFVGGVRRTGGGLC